MHSNSPSQELILTLPPSFTRSRTDPRPRRGSVVVCREFPTASSNKVGTKLGGGGEGGWRRPGSWRSKINPAITPPTPLSLSFSRCPLDPPFLRFCFSTHLLVFIVATRSPHSRRFISLFPNPFSVPPPFLSLKYSNNSRERRGGEVSFGFCGGLVEIRKKRRYRWNFGEIRIGELKGGGIVISRPCSFPPKLTSQGSRIYFSFYTKIQRDVGFFLSRHCRIVPILCSSY